MTIIDSQVHVYAANTPERRKRAIRLRDGVPLPDDGWESIRDTAHGAKLRLDAYGF